jgi:hypothetical protein
MIYTQHAKYILSPETWYKAPLHSAVVQVIGRRPHTAEERVQPSPFHGGFVADQVRLMPLYTVPFHPCFTSIYKSIDDAVLSQQLIPSLNDTHTEYSKQMLCKYLEFDYPYRSPRKIFIERCYVPCSMPERGCRPLCW